MNKCEGKEIADLTFKNTYNKLNNFPQTVGVLYDNLPFDFQLHIKQFERVNPEYEYDRLNWVYDNERMTWTVSILYKHKSIA